MLLSSASSQPLKRSIKRRYHMIEGNLARKCESKSGAASSIGGAGWRMAEKGQRSVPRRNFGQRAINYLQASERKRLRENDNDKL